MSRYTPESRSANLFRYFGWQGGTIHQISAATGVSVADLLYNSPSGYTDSARFSQGALALEAGSAALRESLVPSVYRSVAFWQGVAYANPS